MKTFVFDGDNTLWPCQEFYTAAKSAFVELMLYTIPTCTEEKVRNRFSEIDVRRAGAKNGFGRERFPGSMRLTYEALARENGQKIDTDISQEAWEIGNTVFNPEVYLFYEGVEELLRKYRSEGHRIVLCTKGEPVVQWQKVEANNAGELFDEVYVVPKKDAVLYTLLNKQFGEEGEVVSIGDSLRDDIEAAKEAGLVTVWISGRKGTWGFEEGFEHVEADHVIERVGEIEKVFPFQGESRQRAWGDTPRNVGATRRSGCGG